MADEPLFIFTPKRRGRFDLLISLSGLFFITNISPVELVAFLCVFVYCHESERACSVCDVRGRK